MHHLPEAPGGDRPPSAVMPPFFHRLWAPVLLSLALALPSVARAQGHHVVHRGQNLARIASRYHVPVSALAAANGLGRTDSLRPGQVLVIPDRGVIYVGRGQTLGGIAHSNQVSVADLARANHLHVDSVLAVGQRLLLPGQETARAQEAAADRWGRPSRPGRVTLYRIATRETLRMSLLDSRRRPRRSAMRRLTTLLRHRGDGEHRPPDARLVQLLVRVSDHFGGRRIVVISGFRPAGGYTREASRHTQGHAVDMRISGVPLTELRDYLRSLDDTGIGYYPNSHFVHLDTRDHPAHWTDYSHPGQAAEYGPPRAPDADDANDDDEAEAASDRAEAADQPADATGDDSEDGPAPAARVQAHGSTPTPGG